MQLCVGGAPGLRRPFFCWYRGRRWAEFTHALTEAAKVPCLINSADLEAGTGIVLHLGVARSVIPKQQAANRQKDSRTQAQQEKANKPRC